MKTRIVISTLIVLAFSNLLQAQQPMMDATFGADGKVVTTVGPAASNLNSIAIQPDGKIVAAGFTDGNGRQFALTRYIADGSLDNTFGDNGIVITNVGRASGAYAVALQRDGKIVAAGISYNTKLDFAAVRYNSDGSLDNSFGTNGVALASIGAETDLARTMAIQPDGKIILAGVSNIGEVPNFGLARFNADGSLDNSFGTGGVLTTVFGSDSTDVYAIAVQPDGRIVATGSGGTGLFAMARYLADGTLDKSFDTDGKLTSAIGTGKGLVIQPDKKILISVAAPSKEFRLVRYMPNGTLDKTFGTQGIVSSAFEGEAESSTLALQSDGKIIAAGNSWTETSYADFAVARYLANGTLDPSFGTDGKFYINMGEGFNIITQVALHGDGKILMGGVYNLGEASNFALARLMRVK